MQCSFCSNPATGQCRRCGKLYCDEHGDGVLCDSCLDPASAVPSAGLYRGSLLALLLGTAFAVWLLVRPPDTVPDPATPLVLNPTATTEVPATVEETGTAAVTETAESTATVDDTAAVTEEPGTEEPETATPTRRPRRTPTPRPDEPFEYVVREGDTLSDIADQFDVTVEEIQALNNLTSDQLAIGQVLLIPPPEEEPEETPTAGLLRPRAFSNRL